MRRLRTITGGLVAAALAAFGVVALVDEIGSDRDWETAAVAGVAIADGGGIHVYPTRYYSPSCFDRRARVDSGDAAVLIVHFEVARVGTDCTTGGGSPAASRVTVTTDVDLTPATEVRLVTPEPTEIGPVEDLSRDIAWIQTRRAEGGFATTAADVDSLLRNESFVNNWDDADLPFRDDELDRADAFPLATYVDLVDALVDAADLDHHVVDIETAPPAGAVRVTVVGEGVASQIAELWADASVCRVPGSSGCLATVSTRVLQERVEIEELAPAELSPRQRCGALTPDNPGLLQSTEHRAETWRMVRDVLGGAAVTRPELDLTSTADAARAVVLSPNWERMPPWSTPEIQAAWDAIGPAATACGSPLPALPSA